MRRPLLAPVLLAALPLAVLGCGAANLSEPPPSPLVATTPAAPVAAPVAPLPSAAPSARPEDASLGQLDFPVTGSSECQRRVREGVLALHSFLYDQAHESFAAALAADPACAMAAWGDAMGYEHPIWHERDLAKGRAALARVTHEESLTPRERAYLAAARALFAQADLGEGHRAWLGAAAAMHRDFPDDDEVALQHALALLAVYGYDSAHVGEQMEAGAVALAVLQRRPQHPGAAHYVIHAMDSREHAILALPAARTYARIAPAAGHALHMPSHTFTHLGLWRDVVPSNERAYASSVAWEQARGHTPSKYDWHSYSWLVAARLELGQPSRARKLIDDARALLVEAKDDSAGFRAAYADMVSNYITQADRWEDADALLAPVLAPMPEEGAGGAGPVACAMHAPGGAADYRMPSALFARLTAHVVFAEAAIRRGDRVAAEKRVADLQAVRAQMAPWSRSMPPSYGARSNALSEQLLARARAGARPSAAAHKGVVDALERLLRLESAQQIAGPAWRRTTGETLGEWLLSRGMAKEARARFEAELAARPNRALSLLGAARAAKAAGDGAAARRHYAALLDLWRDADADLPALAEVRAGAAS